MHHFSKVFITATHSYLPGSSVTNDDIDLYIPSVNSASSRIKSRILKENGIKKRYYGISPTGESLETVSGMAAKAIKPLLKYDSNYDFLALATTGGDNAAPGIANMVQGELKLPPLETISINGICAASIGAIFCAAQAVNSGGAKNAIVAASEFPSRLFKASRFKARKDIDFDAHFLRWMLSDGAGACLLSSNPQPNNKKILKIKWIHSISFSGDYPTCMQVGLKKTENNQQPLKGYLDYPNLAEAESEGAYDLRQDIRLLPNLFDVSFHEYAKLVKLGYINPQTISAFLCHYSSEKFKPVIFNLMEAAGLMIPLKKWFSNLQEKGNTGSASILIMLDEFFSYKLQDLPDKSEILCFVPESGRFTASFMMLEVTSYENEIANFQNKITHSLPSFTSSQENTNSSLEKTNLSSNFNKTTFENPAHLIVAPIELTDVSQESTLVQNTIRDLLEVWHDYRSQAFRTSLAQMILNRTITHNIYLKWLENWIPQVREGSLWMRRALASMTHEFKELRNIISVHAGDEQFDWQYLYQDYKSFGGSLDINNLKMNPGGAALNSFMHTYASQINPVGLLGGIYIIEGTGQRIIPSLLPALKESLKLKSEMVRFFEYHGENDQHHLQRWLNALKIILNQQPHSSQEIVRIAQLVSSLYIMQWELIS